MIRYTPGVQVLENFVVPDENGDNIAALTWVAALWKDGVYVTSGVEYDGLSCAGLGAPENSYIVTFTPMTDGATYDISCTSDQGDVWMERLEPSLVVVEGAPSVADSVFKVHASLVSDAKVMNCVSATASLYRGDTQGSPVSSLGSGTEGALNAFYWSDADVSIISGQNYFIRFSFVVSAPGSPSTPVTIVRDLAFAA